MQKKSQDNLPNSESQDMNKGQDMTKGQGVGLPEPDPDYASAEAYLHHGIGILADRGQTYDPEEGKERSMTKIVQAFNIVTGKNLTEAEGWEFMAMVKQVRAFQRPIFHEDSWQDFMNYAALGAEAAHQANVAEHPVPSYTQQDRNQPKNFRVMSVAEAIAHSMYADSQKRKCYNAVSWHELDEHDKQFWLGQADEVCKRNEAIMEAEAMQSAANAWTPSSAKAAGHPKPSED